MVFMDSKFWVEEIPAYNLLRKMAHGKPYDKLITLCDEPEDAIQAILDFHALKKPLLRRLSSAPNKPETRK